MKSKMDATITLDDRNGAITLAKNGTHAVILIELVYENDYQVQRADFLPKNRRQNSEHYYAQLNQFFQKTVTVPGEVRLDNFVGITCATTKSEIEKRANLTQGYSKTWPCSAELITNLCDQIRQEKNNPPQFNISGKPSSTGHNCTSWAEEKLGSVGFQNDVSSFTKSCDSSFATITDLHVPANQDNKSSSIICRII